MAIDEIHAEIIQKCQGSVVFFLRNFCKTKHPSAGIVPFNPFKYQIKALRAFRNHRFSIFRKCRQSGASTISGAFALWFSMFFTHKTVLIVSRTDDDAKAFLRENVAFLFKNLPPWMQEVWKPAKENEHEIVFPNGSHIRSLTSHPDVLRSNASSLNIIDEAAFIQDMSQMWAGGFSCVGVWHHVNVGGSIYEIGELGDLDGEQWQEHDLQVQSDDGLKQSTKFYINGEADVNVITTSLGYNLTCTDNHRIKNTDYEWVYSKDVKLGQRVALKCYYESTPYFDTKLASDNGILEHTFIEAKNKDTVNPQCCQCHQIRAINYCSYKRNVRVNDGLFICRPCATVDNFSPDFDKPEILTEDLAELVGYYVGDGSLSDSRPKRLRLCYDPQDQDIYDHFAKWADTLGLEHHHEDANGAEEFRICNAKFVEWFKLNGLNSKTCAKDAEIPKVILRSHQSVRAAFLRGLFEADGWAGIYLDRRNPAGKTCVGFSSSSEKLVDQVHYMLLDLGIIARKSSGVGGFENSGIRYRLSLINKDHMIQFMSRVGMISKRKSIDIEKKTDKKPEKYTIDENGIFYDDVVKISRDRCMTVDISVPDNNTYIANGFVSHNTLQHGGCLNGDSLIKTSNGIIPIGSLHYDDDIKWEEINLSVSTDIGNGNLSKSYCNGVADTIQIETNDGHYVESTRDHLFRVINQDGNYAWCKASDLFVDDNIVLSCGPSNLRDQYIDLDLDIFNHYSDGCPLCGAEGKLCHGCLTIIKMLSTDNLPRVLDVELAELIGVIWGDGFIDKHGRFGISCDRSYIDFIKWIHDKAEYYGANSHDEVSDNDWSVRFNHKSLALLLRKNGITKTSSRTISIPLLILQSGEDVICAFLRGVAETDGCVSGKYVTISSSSIVFVRQMQTLLLSLGIRSRIYEATRKNGYSDKPQYVLSMKTLRDVEIFRSKIGFISAKKSCKLNNIDHKRTHNDCYTDISAINEFYDATKGVLDNKERQHVLSNKMRQSLPRYRVELLIEKYPSLSKTTLGFLVSNNLFTDTIVSVSKSKCQTYDVTEDTRNTYIANGFVSHNSVIVVSTCVHPDTYIFTSDGMQQIKDLIPNEWQGFEDGYHHADYKGPDVLGINGLETPSKFYKRPTEKTKKVKLSGGYNIEASLRHKMLVLDDEGRSTKRLIQDLSVDDWLPVINGSMIFGDNDTLNYVDSDKRFNDETERTFGVEVITTDLAYLLGVIIAEGHVREQEVIIACGDTDVLDKCCSWKGLYWKRGREDQDYVAINYQPMFVRFLEYLGVELTTAPYKTVPRRLWSCSEPIIRTFLQGLFDGDGSARTRNGEVCLTSTSYELVNQVRQILFNYGIMCREEVRLAGETTFTNKDGSKRTHETRESYNLVVVAKDTHKYYDLIGFGLDRKQKLQESRRDIEWELMPPVVISLLKQLKDSTDLSIDKMTKLGLAPNVLFGRKSITKSRLATFIDRIDYAGNVYFDRIKELLGYDAFLQVKSLVESESEVYDFTLPDTHTYTTNGLISINTNGVGNWYWNTWVDAEANLNPFEPIMINWWDMDWRIEYRDALTNAVRSIAPTDGIRPCKTAEEIQKYGPYWSPWLEEQWRGLQERGEAWKFKQEVLAEFVGSGNTVLDPLVLAKIQLNLSDDYKRVVGNQPYIHPVKGEATFVNFDGGDRSLEPDEGLWVWHAPNEGKPAEYHNGVVINPAIPAHRYIGGVDLATGKGRDYNSIELFDIDSMEQVAEIMIRCIPRLFKYIVDYIGRWFNNALLVVERNNGGDAFIDDLRMELMYPNLWRKKTINDKPTTNKNKMRIAEYGFSTGHTSKSQLNSALQNFFRADDEGIKVNSRRLLKQFQIYVRKKDRAGRDTMKTEAESGPGNFDDLVIAAGLAMIGLPDAIVISSEGLMPFQPTQTLSYSDPLPQTQIEALGDVAKVTRGTDPMFLMPYSGIRDQNKDESIAAELARFTQQLGALPLASQMPTVTSRKHQFNLRK